MGFNQKQNEGLDCSVYSLLNPPRTGIYFLALFVKADCGVPWEDDQLHRGSILLYRKWQKELGIFNMGTWLKQN